MSEREDRMGQAEHREAMLSRLSGRVVELGAGNGINFRHYPSTVTEIVAVEPEPFLRKRAEQAAVAAPVRVSVVDGLGGELPFEDAAFDAAVARWCCARFQRKSRCCATCSESSSPVVSCASTNTYGRTTRGLCGCRTP